ncbi:MAG: XdhC/CoxI family protein [Anaerolineales bacterium]
MRELLPDLENWLKAGEQVALATVISTWGSAPRSAGSAMAVSASGGLVGSVSGGCVEGAVIQAAQEVMRTQRPQRLHFGVADETAWEVGLACGGQIDVFVQTVDAALFGALVERLKAEQSSLLATVIGGTEERLGLQELADKKGRWLQGTQELVPDTKRQAAAKPEIVQRNGDEIFLNPLTASPTLVLIGGVQIAVALAKIARTLNFRTVIIDPRKAFGSVERFAHADQLIQAWPQKAFEQVQLTAATAVASLSHDPKIDDPALKAALASEAFYVGALGSKKTAATRRQRLLQSGVNEKALERLHAPIGLEINAETPEEIALAIMAQVIAAYRG